MAKINITEHHQLLSLPFLHKLCQRNLQRIGDLGGQITNGSVFSCGATTVLLLGCFALFFQIRRRNDKKNRTEVGLDLKLGLVKPNMVINLGPTPDASYPTRETRPLMAFMNNIFKLCICPWLRRPKLKF